MLSVLANRTYRHLFAAQVIALIGAGLMTVALGLLAYRIAGAGATVVRPHWTMVDEGGQLHALRRLHGHHG